MTTKLLFLSSIQRFIFCAIPTSWHSLVTRDMTQLSTSAFLSCVAIVNCILSSALGASEPALSWVFLESQLNQLLHLFLIKQKIKRLLVSPHYAATIAEFFGDTLSRRKASGCTLGHNCRFLMTAINVLSTNLDFALSPFQLIAHPTLKKIFWRHEISPNDKSPKLNICHIIFVNACTLHWNFQSSNFTRSILTENHSLG